MFLCRLRRYRVVLGTLCEIVVDRGARHPENSRHVACCSGHAEGPRCVQCVDQSHPFRSREASQTSVLLGQVLADELVDPALPVVLKAIAAGEIDATVRQDPAQMGATGVDLAIAIIMGEVVDAFIPIDGILITIDNVADYLTE